MRPAASRTLRCLVMDGALMEKGSASCLTDVSPKARRARIARRVGSESAAKVVLRGSDIQFTNRLISLLVNYRAAPNLSREIQPSSFDSCDGSGYARNLDWRIQGNALIEPFRSIGVFSKWL